MPTAPHARRPRFVMPKPKPIPFLGGEIRLDAAGHPDDLAFGFDGTPIRVHIERMDERYVWIGLDDDKGNHLRLGISSASPVSFPAETEPVHDDRIGLSIGFDAHGRPAPPLPDYDPTNDADESDPGSTLPAP